MKFLLALTLSLVPFTLQANSISDIQSFNDIDLQFLQVKAEQDILSDEAFKYIDLQFEKMYNSSYYTSHRNCNK